MPPFVRARSYIPNVRWLLCSRRSLAFGCISTSVGEFREQCRKSLAHLAVLRLLLTRAELPPARRRRTRGVDVRTALRPQAAVRFLRENKVTLVYDQATVTRQDGKSETVKTIIRKATGSSAVVYREQPQGSQAVADIEAGNADYVADQDPSLAPGAAVAREFSQPAAGHPRRYFATPLLATDELAFDTKHGLFADARTRQAVNYALDRPALATALGDLVAIRLPSSRPPSAADSARTAWPHSRALTALSGSATQAKSSSS